MITFQINNIVLKNRYVLAPLAGFTDYSMRQMVSDYGCSLVYTEMTSCEALFYKSKVTIKDVMDTKLDQYDDTKVALQIFGGKRESVLASIPLIEHYGHYDFVDFNCGCPVPKVVKQEAGSSWLNRPEELLSLLKEMVNLSHKPVLVKIRLGFNQILDDLPSFAKRIEETGVKAIAIHGRTRSEFFKGPVHYDEIRKVKESVTIPVIANGEINENNFLDVLDTTKADAVMIGQRALGYPKVFQDMIEKEQGKEISPNSLERQIEDLKKHLRLIFSFKEEKSASDIMRGISTKYIRGYDNCVAMRAKLVHCHSLQEYLDILDSVHFEQ